MADISTVYNQILPTLLKHARSSESMVLHRRMWRAMLCKLNDVCEFFFHPKTESQGCQVSVRIRLCETLFASFFLEETVVLT